MARKFVVVCDDCGVLAAEAPTRSEVESRLRLFPMIHGGRHDGRDLCIDCITRPAV